MKSRIAIRHPLVGTVTNIRTHLILLSLLADLALPCAAYDDAALPTSVTGAVALHPLDAVWCPSLAISNAAIEIAPAPYLLPDLTRGRIGVPVWEGLLMVEGGSGGGWTEVGVRGVRGFEVTPTFLVGLQVRAAWEGAAGFAGVPVASVGVQGMVLLDSAWTVAIAMDDLLFASNWRGPPPRCVRLGCSWKADAVLAADVVLRPQHGVGVLLSALYAFSDAFKGRLALLTEPLSAEASVRAAVDGLVPITLCMGSRLNLGFTVRMVVEW